MWNTKSIRERGVPELGIVEKETVRNNRDELLQSLRDGKYKPSPVRRKEIPKSDGSGVRKLGIPTVKDRVIQQAIAQQLQPLFESLSQMGAMATVRNVARNKLIRKVKAYAEQGYSHAVEIDLEKVFRYAESRVADEPSA